jgi:hypothetical protein
VIAHSALLVSFVVSFFERISSFSVSNNRIELGCVLFVASPCTSPSLCGPSDVYCPMGIGQPLVVGEGYYSVGIVGMRSDVALCAAGSYCPGDGLSYLCPVGTFGDMDGQTNSSCSGDCQDGVVCDAGSTSPLGRPCPVGQYCVSGVAYPCPSGTYNNRVGASNSSECTACPPGRFNNRTGAWDAAMCLLCPTLEGSDAGASACWPGLLGARVEDPEPVVPGLSKGDVITLYFTKQTNSPDVSSTAAILNLLAFEPWLASSIQGLVRVPVSRCLLVPPSSMLFLCLLCPVDDRW